MPKILCTCVYAIVCMSARKKAPVNLLMCPFELYMFIGVSMQLRVVFKYDFLVLIPYCWSVALEKKKKKNSIPDSVPGFIRIPLCTEMTATFDLALEVKGQFPT